MRRTTDRIGRNLCTLLLEAVKHQLLIMFLSGAGSGFEVVCAICMIEKHLFDERHRLVLDKLLPAG